MLQQFKTYIEKQQLFFSTEKILLTVSGGIDSVVMCELFYKAGINFGIAHCNFKLRGDESDGDELFVKELAKKYKVPFFSKRFDTKIQAAKKKISIQMAARDLRYEWFQEVLKNNDCNYIATAHHQDDSIETFFINIIRGTGISGLHGILPKQGKIIRPLLFATKKEIEKYADTNKLRHREDSSNTSDKYARNKIRHQVVPVLKELNPNLETTISNDMYRLRAVELIYKNEIENKRSKIVIEQEKRITISIEKLKKLNPISTYLYEFLKPFNYNVSTVEELVEALGGESGKQFFSKTHRLIKDRDLLLIEKLVKAKKNVTSSFLVEKKQRQMNIDDHKLKFKTKINPNYQQLISGNQFANINFDKLQFPLEIRKWKQGDVFYPLGMKGKKKLSDYFIDKKLSIDQKENIWLLTSRGNIVWIIGHRMDDRFKITEKTSKIYFVELV